MATVRQRGRKAKMEHGAVIVLFSQVAQHSNIAFRLTTRASVIVTMARHSAVGIPTSSLEQRNRNESERNVRLLIIHVRSANDDEHVATESHRTQSL